MFEERGHGDGDLPREPVLRAALTAGIVEGPALRTALVALGFGPSVPRTALARPLPISSVEPWADASRAQAVGSECGKGRVLTTDGDLLFSAEDGIDPKVWLARLITCQGGGNGVRRKLSARQRELERVLGVNHT